MVVLVVRIVRGVERFAMEVGERREGVVVGERRGEVNVGRVIRGATGALLLKREAGDQPPSKW